MSKHTRSVPTRYWSGPGYYASNPLNSGVNVESRVHTNKDRAIILKETFGLTNLVYLKYPNQDLPIGTMLENLTKKNGKERQ